MYGMRRTCGAYRLNFGSGDRVKALEDYLKIHDFKASNFASRDASILSYYAHEVITFSMCREMLKFRPAHAIAFWRALYSGP